MWHIDCVIVNSYPIAYEQHGNIPMKDSPPLPLPMPIPPAPPALSVAAPPWRGVGCGESLMGTFRFWSRRLDTFFGFISASICILFVMCTNI